MNRRDFLAAGLAVTAATATGTAQDPSALDPGPPDEAKSTDPQPVEAERGDSRRFLLNYAPHFGTFSNSAGHDVLDQLKFIADNGFAAIEDNGMKGRPAEQQQQIARLMEQLGLKMGVFVATGSFSEATFASGDEDAAAKVLADIRESVEVAKRVGARWMTVVPGTFEHRLPIGYQTANVIELLKRCAAILEPHGLVMVLEPLNHYANHPELFLHLAPQAYLLCRAVDSPACKILFDIYHQQISEGNLIPNIDHCWDEIAYFQAGDNPGRKEPGTGEINFQNIFKYIHAQGYQGIIGMEHGNSLPGQEGEQAVIEAYARADRF